MSVVRVERIGSATLYLGRCEDVLPSLSGVDLVITSPPYNMRDPALPTSAGHAKSLWRASKLEDGYGLCGNNLPHEEYVAWQKSVLRLLWNTLSADGAIFFNHKPRSRNGEIWLPTSLNPGLPLRQIITWVRGACINFSLTHFASAYEWLLVFAKADFRLKSRAASVASDCWNIVPDTHNKHPASFPIALPSRVLEATSGQVVFDPFCGSGTVGAACAIYGREFVGIELEPPFYEMALRRIEKAQRQSDLFIAPSGTVAYDRDLRDLFSPEPAP